MFAQGFLRFLLYLLLFYVVFKVVGFFLKPTRRSGPPPSAKKESGLMVKDEVCNTYLPKDQAIKVIDQGQEHFFCSQECRTKYLESRQKG